LGELPPGAVEEIKTRALREQLGARLAAVAGADFSGPITEREVDDPHPQSSARHPEVRGAERRASKGDGPGGAEQHKWKLPGRSASPLPAGGEREKKKGRSRLNKRRRSR
jgi:23S rRNA pseudouridine2605 synthase